MRAYGVKIMGWTRRQKGLGLLGKVILFSVIPSYLIVGFILYLHQRDLKSALNQKYIEDTLSAASLVQRTIRPEDLVERPAWASSFLKAIVQLNPDLVRINIYAPGGGTVKVVASSDPDEIGEVADPKDVRPLITGESIYEEHPEGDVNLFETITPYLQGGKPVASIGIYTSTTHRNAVVAHLTRQTFWFAVTGCALILIAIFFVIHRVLLVRIQLLSRAADDLARGELDRRLPVRGSDELSHLTRSFNSMASSLVGMIGQLNRKAAELERKNGELESFVYTVSHDLKSPVVSLRWVVGMFEEDCGGLLDDTAKGYLERMKTNTRNMEQLITDLLELSRIGRITGPPEDVSVARLLGELLERDRQRIEAKKIRIRLAPQFPTLRGERRRLMQVFDNLLSNAIKFMGDQPNPQIEVGWRDQGVSVEFYVRDNGIGIDPQFHEKIFQIFQRIQEIEVEGTGVGMTIVKKIVEQVGGRVWVESEKGKGATFYFTWPRERREEEVANA